jgi:hypothetical protein
VKRKWRLKEAEAYQSVPSARALLLADFIAHLFYFLEAAKLWKWCRRSVHGVQRWYGLFFFAFFFLSSFPPWGLVLCLSKYVRSVLIFPYLCFCPAKRILDKVRGDMKC